MKLVRVISTAVLFLLLGTTAPAYVQNGQEEKGGDGGKAQEAQPQRAQPVERQQEPQHAQPVERQQEPQHAQPVERQQEPQHAQPVERQQEPQRAQPVQRQQDPQRAQSVAYNGGNNGNHYGRIPDDRYRAHFGRDHSFRMIRPRMIGGYNRFPYGGYWFGFNEPWPSGWYYTDDVYVEYVGGAYYLYNPRHPGIHITLNLF